MLTAVTPSELSLSTVTSQYVIKDIYFADHIQTLLCSLFVVVLAVMVLAVIT